MAHTTTPLSATGVASHSGRNPPVYRAERARRSRGLRRPRGPRSPGPGPVQLLRHLAACWKDNRRVAGFVAEWGDRSGPRGISEGGEASRPIVRHRQRRGRQLLCFSCESICRVGRAKRAPPARNALGLVGLASLDPPYSCLMTLRIRDYFGSLRNAAWRRWSRRVIDRTPQFDGIERPWAELGKRDSVESPWSSPLGGARRRRPIRRFVDDNRDKPLVDAHDNGSDFEGSEALYVSSFVVREALRCDAAAEASVVDAVLMGRSRRYP